ncbi:MAG: hypothetical protein EPN17_07235 [Methylobacter sp.]|nr:MAG: hypothetical protein EPN17_07235 [Methylobacter sp.]
MPLLKMIDPGGKLAVVTCNCCISVFGGCEIGFSVVKNENRYINVGLFSVVFIMSKAHLGYV